MDPIHVSIMYLSIRVGTYVLELVNSVTLKVQISEHVMHTCHACVCDDDAYYA